MADSRRLNVLALALCCGLPLAGSGVLRAEEPPGRTPPSAVEPAPSTDDAKKKDAAARVKTTIAVTAKGAPRKTELSPDVRSLPANSSVIDATAIQAKTYREPAEILRSEPGVDFVYYGQGGAPSGPAVRGYTDRNFGQDIAGFLDGIPLNLFGFVASHGAMDLTPLFPETIERVELVRGPLDARYGDFNRGASVNWVTKEGAARPSVAIGGGSYGARRAQATFGSADPERFSIYANLELSNVDGYADNQRVEHVKTFNRVSVPLGRGDLAVTGLGFWSHWDAPSYLDINLVKSGAVSDRDAVNPTDGGKENNRLLYLRYRLDATSSDPLILTVHAGRRDWTRWRSDFLLSPTQTQTQQIDARSIYGYRIEKTLAFSLLERPGTLLFGSNLQRDIASTQQATSLKREVISRTDDVDERLTNLGVYAQGQWVPKDWLKLMAGVRYSYVNDQIGDNIRAPGTYVDSFSTSRVSPKVAITVSPVKELDVYANYATGMRSPTPRSEVRNSIDSVGRVEIAETKSYEVGMSWRLFDRVALHADVWRADNSNEIRGIPPGGVQFESLGASRRKGVDLEASVFLGSAARLYTAFSWVDVRLTTPLVAGADHLPDVPRYVHLVGLETQVPVGARLPGRVLVGVDAGFYGSRDLNTTGTLQSETYERVGFRVSFNADAGYRVFLGGSWYPGSRFGESAFLFNTKIGVRPVPRLSLDGGLAYTF